MTRPIDSPVSTGPLDLDVFEAAVEAAAAAIYAEEGPESIDMDVADADAYAALAAGVPLLLDALVGRIEAQSREAYRRWMPSPEAYNAFADGRFEGISRSAEIVRSFAREVPR